MESKQTDMSLTRSGVRPWSRELESRRRDCRGGSSDTQVTCVHCEGNKQLFARLRAVLLQDSISRGPLEMFRLALSKFSVRKSIFQMFCTAVRSAERPRPCSRSVFMGRRWRNRHAKIGALSLQRLRFCGISSASSKPKLVRQILVSHRLVLEFRCNGLVGNTIF